MAKPFQLGKGLSSLIPKKIADEVIQSVQPAVVNQDSIVNVDPKLIAVNPNQPRQHFDDGSLDELMNSIKEHGILQPLVISKSSEGQWQLIAGERRLRAAVKLGLKTVPTLVRSVTQQQSLEISLIENIQRQNLNPIEEAIAYRRLHDEFNLTQEEVAKRVGKSRPQVANTIRLLDLSPAIQQAVAGGKLTLGHAKVILSLDDPAEQEKFFKSVVEGGLTVKETTWGVKQAKSRGVKAANKDLGEFKALSDSLRQALGTKVVVKPAGKAIKVEIEYYSMEEIESFLERLR